MNTVNVTIEDLWPGDVIITRRPGWYTGIRCRFSYAEQKGRMIKVYLSSPCGGGDFEALADSWKDSVELVRR